VADTSQISPFVFGLGGGLVLNKDSFSYQPGETKVLKNFEPDVKGGYKKILGTTKFNTNIVPQVSAATERVVMSTIFNGVVLAARGGSIHRAASGSGSWTSTITGLGTPTQNYTFRKFNFDGTDRIVICTGTSSPQLITSGFSASVINATGTANFKFVEVFKNHLFFAGDASNKQQLSFMGPFETNDFTTSNGGGVIKVDTEIKGLKVFRDSLFIFGQDKIFKLTGNTSSDFVIAPVTRKIGCVDGGSIQELGGDIIYLAPDGLRTIAGTERIGDVELGTISKQIQQRIDDITLDNITSLVIRNKSQYRLFYPITTGSETSAKGIIGVIKTNPNTGQLGYEYADMEGIKVSSTDSDFIVNTETIINGGYDGYVYLQESGNEFTRSGTTAAIQSRYRSPDLTMGDPGIRKNMQRVIINYTNEGAVDANLQVRYDFDASTTPQPPAVPITTGNIPAIYATGIYNTSVYGQSGIPLVRQHVIGSGFAVALKVTDDSTNPPISLKGFELEFVPGGRR
tara:strand:- start:142 stop:1680 length:1539 start_codon:yes stop_codon:yes gene_type:complete